MGDWPIYGRSNGVAGAVQLSNGDGKFTSDVDIFWEEPANRLHVGPRGATPTAGTANVYGHLWVDGKATDPQIHFVNDVSGRAANDGFVIGNNTSNQSYLINYEAGPIRFATQGNYRWNVSSSGHILAETDNSFDIGATGATRPRSLFVAGSGAIAQAGAGSFTWDTSGRIGHGIAVQTNSIYQNEMTHPGTGTSVFGFVMAPIAPATATSLGEVFRSQVRTAAASFTQATANAYKATIPSLGAGSAVTNLSGFRIQNQGSAQVANAYGVYVEAQNTASTLNIGVRIDAASNQTLWVGADTNGTTAGAGMAFGASRDTNLYRSATGTLKTDTVFESQRAGFGMTQSVNYTVRIAGGATGSLAVGADADGTTTARGLFFGSSGDTVIYRAAANTLAMGTGDAFHIDLGAVGTPGLAFVGDANTGIFSPGADQLNLVSGGTSRVLLDASGRVGISATNGLSLFSVAGNNALTGTGYGSAFTTSFQASTISDGREVYIQATTSNTANTIATLQGLYIADANKGALATVTNLYGGLIKAQTAGASNYGLAIEAASTQTLWVSSDANNTTAAAGLAFGLSRDTVWYRSNVGTTRTNGSIISESNLSIANTARIGSTSVVAGGRLQVDVISSATGSGVASITSLNQPAATTNFVTAAQTGNVSGVFVGANTITAAVASTIPDLSAVHVVGPIPSTNVTATRSAAIFVQTGADGNVGLALRQNSGTQSGNMLAVQNSAGTAIVAIRENGRYNGIDGTAAEPGVSFLNDTNNGLYRIGTDEWAASAGSLKHETWKNSGGTLQWAVFGGTARNQPAAIADAAGGAVVDAEARTAINALLAAMRGSTGLNLIAG